MNFFKHVYRGGVLFLLPLVVGAQSTASPGIPGPSTYAPGIPSPSTVTCDPHLVFCNPLATDSICGALKLFLNALLTLGIPVAVLFLVYAGFRFVWARGNPTALKTARTNLIYVVIGISVFIGAWLLGQIVANTLGSLSSQAGQPNAQIGSCVNS